MKAHQHNKPLWLDIDLLNHTLIMSKKVYPGLALVCPGLQPPMFQTADSNINSVIIILIATIAGCPVRVSNHEIWQKT